ncbi:hypothetical protein [Haladaptatus sp. W1]|nr:hypothetical protein [Haladaptatus sp. W1]
MDDARFLKCEPRRFSVSDCLVYPRVGHYVRRSLTLRDAAG